MARIEPSYITSFTQVVRIDDLLARVLPSPKIEVEDDPLDLKSGVAQMLADTGGRLNEVRGLSGSVAGFGGNRMSSSNMALQASALVGRSLLVKQHIVEVENAKEVQGHIELPSKGRHVLVYVQSKQGEIVKIIPLGDMPKGKAFFRWQGDNRQGMPVAPGTYRFIVSAILGSGLASLPVSTFLKIVRVATDPGQQQLELVLENGARISYSPSLLLLEENV